MELLKLIAVFAVILAILWIKRPLYQAVAGGIVATVLLYGIGLIDFARLTVGSVTSRSTIEIVLIIYLITYLQRMLEKRGLLMLAQKSLNGIFNNRRINASLAPLFIGLLPSPAAVTICGEIVDEATGDYLDKEEKTFVTTYFRHIPESFLPTYQSILISCSLSGVAVSSFVGGMLPMVVVLFILGQLFYLRKVPKETGDPPSENKGKDWLNLVKSLWSLFLIIFLILAFDNVTVIQAVVAVLILSIFVNRFKVQELVELIPRAFDLRMIVNTFLIYIFKDVLVASGIITLLPGYFAKLPIPTYLVFVLLFFFGSLVAGSGAIAATCIPLAFQTIPGGGMPLLVLLNGFAYAAMQVGPTHICLAVVTEYFGTNMASLIKKTLPVIATFCVILLGYYGLLNIIF